MANIPRHSVFVFYSTDFRHRVGTKKIFMKTKHPPPLWIFFVAFGLALLRGRFRQRLFLVRLTPIVEKWRSLFYFIEFTKQTKLFLITASRVELMSIKTNPSSESTARQLEKWLLGKEKIICQKDVWFGELLYRWFSRPTNDLNPGYE